MSTETEVQPNTQPEIIPTRAFSAGDLESLGKKLDEAPAGFLDETDDTAQPTPDDAAPAEEGARQWFEEEEDGAAEDPDAEDPELKAKLDALELSDPWRKKRLNRESEKRQAAERRAELAEAELQRYRTGAPPTAPQLPTGAPQSTQAPSDEQMEAWIVQNDPNARKAAQTLEAIREQDFATVGEFNRAYLAAQRALDRTVDRVRVGMSQEIAQQQTQAETQRQAMERTASEFIAKAEKSTIPGFQKQFAAFRKIAPEIHDAIHLAIAGMDESDAAVAAIMSSRANADYFRAASQNPARIPAALAKLGALTEAYKAQATTKSPTQTPAAPPNAPASPQIPRGEGGGNGIAYHTNLRKQIGVAAYMKGVMSGKYPDLSGVLD